MKSVFFWPQAPVSQFFPWQKHYLPEVFCVYSSIYKSILTPLVYPLLCNKLLLGLSTLQKQAFVIDSFFVS